MKTKPKPKPKKYQRIKAPIIYCRLCGTEVRQSVQGRPREYCRPGEGGSSGGAYCKDVAFYLYHVGHDGEEIRWPATEAGAERARLVSETFAGLRERFKELFLETEMRRRRTAAGLKSGRQAKLF